MKTLLFVMWAIMKDYMTTVTLIDWGHVCLDLFLYYVQ